MAISKAVVPSDAATLNKELVGMSVNRVVRLAADKTKEMAVEVAEAIEGDTLADVLNPVATIVAGINTPLFVAIVRLVAAAKLKAVPALFLAEIVTVTGFSNEPA